MPVMIEINSGRETNKTGVMLEAVDALVKQMDALEHIQVEGLMTMGPRFGDPEDSRPYFKTTRKAFERLDPYEFAECNHALSLYGNEQ